MGNVQYFPAIELAPEPNQVVLLPKPNLNQERSTASEMSVIRCNYM